MSYKVTDLLTQTLARQTQTYNLRIPSRDKLFFLLRYFINLPNKTIQTRLCFPEPNNVTIIVKLLNNISDRSVLSPCFFFWILMFVWLSVEVVVVDY